MSDLLLFPDDEQWGDFPPDFTDENTDQNTLDTLGKIREAVGRPLQPLIADIQQINQRGQAASVRGIRFTSGVDALIWLFRRGIFLFSNVVRMGDGTWGVSIRNSDQADNAELDEQTGDDESDLIF